MSINMSTPAAVANVVSGGINSFQSGIEIGTSANAYKIYSNLLNAAGSIIATTPMGAPINAAAAVNGTVGLVAKWEAGTLTPSDVASFTGTALTLAIAAGALTGTPVSGPQ